MSEILLRNISMENSWFSLTPGAGLATSSAYLSLGILTKDEWMMDDADT